MKRLSFRPFAQSDIQEIWLYTAKNWSIAQADNYTDDIRNACKKLAGGDLNGKKVKLKKTYLQYRVTSHMIYFLDLGDEIEIVRVLHGGMDAQRHL